MAAKAPRMLGGARGIAAPPKANERAGIAADDAAARSVPYKGFSGVKDEGWLDEICVEWRSRGDE